MKSKALLDSFTQYCKENPSQRFWQALSNWAQAFAIMVFKPKLNTRCMTDYQAAFDDMGLKDTFYSDLNTGL